MKKLLCIGVALTFLSACTSYEPDLDKAAEQRAESRAEIRNQIGCQFANDHDAYRRCVLSTYEHNKPKTFTTTQDYAGQPVAVVSNGVSKGTVYADAPVTAPVTAPTVQLQPVAEQETVAPQTISIPVPTVALPETGVVPCATTSNCMYKTQELYEAELTLCPECVPQKIVMEQAPIIVQQPKVVTIEQTEAVVEKPLEVIPAPQPLPDKTWWETYQEVQEPVKPTIVCPCPDPNDPCPQCVTK